MIDYDLYSQNNKKQIDPNLHFIKKEHIKLDNNTLIDFKPIKNKLN